MFGSPCEILHTALTTVGTRRRVKLSHIYYRFDLTHVDANVSRQAEVSGQLSVSVWQAYGGA